MIFSLTQPAQLFHVVSGSMTGSTSFVESFGIMIVSRFIGVFFC